MKAGTKSDSVLQYDSFRNMQIFDEEAAERLLARGLNDFVQVLANRPKSRDRKRCARSERDG